MVRKRKKKSGSFRRRALKSARMRKAKQIRLATRKMTVERIRLDRGGYVSGGFRKGQYYGTGAPLYRVFSPEGDELIVVRASDAKTAKAKAALFTSIHDSTHSGY
jgi:hypothetical protein